MNHSDLVLAVSPCGVLHPSPRLVAEARRAGGGGGGGQPDAGGRRRRGRGAAGGIGPRTAAACVVGGAAGVVLDSQLALMPESDLPDEVLAAVAQHGLG